jgi:diacylglycerol kinase (ATP)
VLERLAVARVAKSIQIEKTRAAGDEEEIARALIRDGVESIVAVGGDGTCSKIARAILTEAPSCNLAVIPCGTGNDFAKMLGVDLLSPEQVLALVERGSLARVDVGRVGPDYFLNSCGFGFDPSVLAATKRIRFLKGNAVYIVSAVAQLFSYRGIDILIDSQGETSARRMLMLTVSNGRFLGGAFRIAPDASVLDGVLDVGYFADSGLIGRIRMFAGALRGTHLDIPSVRSERVGSMIVCSPKAPMLEVDGELREAESPTVKIKCVPRALNAIVAPGFPL